MKKIYDTLTSALLALAAVLAVGRTLVLVMGSADGTIGSFGAIFFGIGVLIMAVLGEFIPDKGAAPKGRYVGKFQK